MRVKHRIKFWRTQVKLYFYLHVICNGLSDLYFGRSVDESPTSTLQFHGLFLRTSLHKRFADKRLGGGTRPMNRAVYLTEKQWEKIKPLLPKLKSNGRPWKNNRFVLEGILWILRTGARWKDLLEKYPSPSTCWRRLKMWGKGFGWRSGVSLSRSWIRKAKSIGPSVLWTAVLYQQKKGPKSWGNQAWQGLQAHGGGRWQEYSFGSIHYLCQSTWGNPRLRKPWSG